MQNVQHKGTLHFKPAIIKDNSHSLKSAAVTYNHPEEHWGRRGEGVGGECKRGLWSPLLNYFFVLFFFVIFWKEAPQKVRIVLSSTCYVSRPRELFLVSEHYTLRCIWVEFCSKTMQNFRF